MIRKLSTLVTVGALLSAFGSAALAYNLEGKHLGSAASPQSTDRQIQLRPGDKYLNVNRGETVLIKAGAGSFAWKFDTLGTPVFNLEEIAPKELNLQGVKVYVGKNPYEVSD